MSRNILLLINIVLNYFLLKTNSLLFYIIALIITIGFYVYDLSCLDIRILRTSYKKIKGIFILLPIALLSFVCCNLFGTPKIAFYFDTTQNVSNLIMILSAVVCTISLYGRLRIYLLPNKINIPICGIIFALLLHNAGCVFLGMLITYLYVKYQWLIVPILIAVCSFCFFPIVGITRLLLLLIPALFLIKFRNRIKFYGNPVYEL